MTDWEPGNCSECGGAARGVTGSDTWSHVGPICSTAFDATFVPQTIEVRGERVEIAYCVRTGDDDA